jgi:hypothetical protein
MREEDVMGVGNKVVLAGCLPRKGMRGSDWQRADLSGV